MPKKKLWDIFETEITINNIISKDHYKLNKIGGDFYDNYIKYKSNGCQKLSTEQYLAKIRPYLGAMINDLRTSGEW